MGGCIDCGRRHRIGVLECEAPSPPPQPATTRLAAEADDLEQRYVAQRERAERAEEALRAAEARIRALEGGA